MIQEFLDIVGTCPAHLSNEQLRTILDDPLLLTEVMSLVDQLRSNQITVTEFNLRVCICLVSHQLQAAS
ncbi:hypothetical protein [Leptolyngbya sp. FACHB-261]|uniref:hypothetical protein n=1 Tax=Leptolyngbya sp. FACHB-261 TaxID=2692806 RepID=UPI001689D90C|nr:hypothetical protein [Leptolyngbya sp. FACHB-261]MBD2101400.1 hypothetical protein [Leptolyngbya sp. FACHB-261]